MAILFVGLGGFATIQEAIDAASDGDHILVSAGVYSGFEVDKPLTIEGQGDVRIVGSFRADNEIPLNTSVADWITEAEGFDGCSGEGIHVYGDGVTLTNLSISSFVNGIVFDDADDLVLNNVRISDTVVGILKDGDDPSSGFRMIGGSISDSYLGISIETALGMPPVFESAGKGGPEAIISESSTPFDDVIIDGVSFTNITYRAFSADALSNAQLLNLVMDRVGFFGESPALSWGWDVGRHAAGIDINIESGFFDNIVISGFSMRDVGAGSSWSNDGAGISLRSEPISDEFPSDFAAAGAAIIPPRGNVLIENGVVDGTSVAYRLGTDGRYDDIWANVSVQNVLLLGHHVSTFDNQSQETLLVSGTSQGDILEANDTTEGRLVVLGGTGDDRITGGWGNDQLDGGANNDLIFTRSGVDTATGGDGNDGVYFGRYFNQDPDDDGPTSPSGSDSAAAAIVGFFDEADGGAGTDTFVLQGNYFFTSLPLVTNFEVLLLASGSDPSFDFIHGREIRSDAPGAAPVMDSSFYYNIHPLDSLVAPGVVFTVMAAGLQSGETLIFDGSHEHDGSFRMFAGRGLNILTGGDGNDGFMFGGNPFGTLDRVDGGAGIDSIAFRGDYSGANRIVLGDNAFTNVEIVALLSGHTNEYGGVITPGGFDYELVMADGNVRAGQRLDIIAGSLWGDETLIFNGSDETNGSFRVIAGAGNDHLVGGSMGDLFYGGMGADVMDGGDGADVYLYRSAGESTAAQTDWITLGAGDKIDLSALNPGGLLSFIGSGAFHHVANELRTYQTDGHWVAEADVNGDGLADLVININSPAPVGADAFNL